MSTIERNGEGELEQKLLTPASGTVALKQTWLFAVVGI